MTCLVDISSGSASIVHLTISLQDGVVRLPSYRKNEVVRLGRSLLSWNLSDLIWSPKVVLFTGDWTLNKITFKLHRLQFVVDLSEILLLLPFRHPNSQNCQSIFELTSFCQAHSFTNVHQVNLTIRLSVRRFFVGLSTRQKFYLCNFEDENFSQYKLHRKERISETISWLLSIVIKVLLLQNSIFRWECVPIH